MTLRTTGEPLLSEPSDNIDIHNAFRLREEFSKTLDLGIALMKVLTGRWGGRKYEGIAEATIGLLYNFKNKD